METVHVQHYPHLQALKFPQQQNFVPRQPHPNSSLNLASNASIPVAFPTHSINHFPQAVYNAPPPNLQPQLLPHVQTPIHFNALPQVLVNSERNVHIGIPYINQLAHALPNLGSQPVVVHLSQPQFVPSYYPRSQSTPPIQSPPNSVRRVPSSGQITSQHEAPLQIQSPQSSSHLNQYQASQVAHRQVGSLHLPQTSNSGGSRPNNDGKCSGGGYSVSDRVTPASNASAHISYASSIYPGPATNNTSTGYSVSYQFPVSRLGPVYVRHPINTQYDVTPPVQSHTTVSEPTIPQAAKDSLQLSQQFTPAVQQQFTAPGQLAQPQFTPSGQLQQQQFTPSGQLQQQQFTPSGQLQQQQFTPTVQLPQQFTPATQLQQQQFVQSAQLLQQQFAQRQQQLQRPLLQPVQQQIIQSQQPVQQFVQHSALQYIQQPQQQYTQNLTPREPYELPQTQLSQQQYVLTPEQQQLRGPEPQQQQSEAKHVTHGFSGQSALWHPPSTRSYIKKDAEGVVNEGVKVEGGRGRGWRKERKHAVAIIDPSSNQQIKLMNSPKPPPQNPAAQNFLQDQVYDNVRVNSRADYLHVYSETLEQPQLINNIGEGFVTIPSGDGLMMLESFDRCSSVSSIVSFSGVCEQFEDKMVDSGIANVDWVGEGYAVKEAGCEVVEHNADNTISAAFSSEPVIYDVAATSGGGYIGERADEYKVGQNDDLTGRKYDLMGQNDVVMVGQCDKVAGQNVVVMAGQYDQVVGQNDKVAGHYDDVIAGQYDDDATVSESDGGLDQQEIISNADTTDVVHESTDCSIITSSSDCVISDGTPLSPYRERSLLLSGCDETLMSHEQSSENVCSLVQSSTSDVTQHGDDDDDDIICEAEEEANQNESAHTGEVCNAGDVLIIEKMKDPLQISTIEPQVELLTIESLNIELEMKPVDSANVNEADVVENNNTVESKVAEISAEVVCSENVEAKNGSVESGVESGSVAPPTDDVESEVMTSAMDETVIGEGLDLCDLINTVNDSSNPEERTTDKKKEMSVTGGIKSYNRDTLLKIGQNAVCQVKPGNLPHMPDVILDMPRRDTQGQGQATGSSGQMMSHSATYPSFNDFFTPNYLSSGGGGVVRGGVSSVPRSAPHSGGMGQSLRSVNSKPDLSSSHMVINIKKDVELNRAEKAWKPASKNKREEGSDPEANKTQALYKTIRSILNKITPQKLDVLIEQVVGLQIDNEERMSGVIDILFEKAISEPSFCPAYAKLANKMMLLKVPMSDKPEQTVNFRKLLLNCCQREFEKSKQDDADMEQKRLQIEKTESEEAKKTLKEELDQAMFISRKKSLGNIRFIAELFKLRMLTEGIMHDCVRRLLISGDEDSLECLAGLLTNIGKDLDTDTGSNSTQKRKSVDSGVSAYFAEIRRLSNDKNVSSRIRFMLRDVIELRVNKWVPRRAANNPKTIQQIHEEAHNEKIEKEQLLKNLPTPAPPKNSRFSQGRPSTGGATGGEDDWTPVSSRRETREKIDPTKFMKISKTSMLDENTLTLGPRMGANMWGSGSRVDRTSPDGAEINPANRYAALELSQDSPPKQSRESKSSSEAGATSRTSNNGVRQRDERGSYNNSGHGGGQRRGGGGGSRGGMSHLTPGVWQDERRDSNRRHNDGWESGRTRRQDEGWDNKGRRWSLAPSSVARQQSFSSSSRSSAGGASRGSAELSSRESSLSRAATPPSANPDPFTSSPLPPLAEKSLPYIVQEYHSIVDEQEACLSLRELQLQKAHLASVVQTVLNCSLEKPVKQRHLTGDLLVCWVKNKILTADDILKGIQELLPQMDDLIVDIPLAWDYLASMIGPVVRDEILSLRHLVNTTAAAATSSDARQTANLLLPLLKDCQLVQNNEYVKDLWLNSELRWSDVVCDNFKSILIDKGLDYLL